MIISYAHSTLIIKNNPMFEPGPEIPCLPPEFTRKHKKDAVLDLLCEMEDYLLYMEQLRGRISRMVDIHMNK